jgi:hypothetical protein
MIDEKESVWFVQKNAIKRQNDGEGQAENQVNHIPVYSFGKAFHEKDGPVYVKDRNVFFKFG